MSELTDLPVLTVLPPWGSAIARWGKPWENRPNPPPASIRGRPLLIHQGVLPLTRRGAISTSPAGQRFAAGLRMVVELTGRTEAEILAQLREDEARVLCTVTINTWATIAPAAARVTLHVPPTGEPIALQPWMIPHPDHRVCAWKLEGLSVLDDRPRLRGQQGIWRMP